MNESFPQRVKRLRKAKRLTIRALAEALQIRQSEVMLIEAGFLYVIDVAYLARALDCDLNELAMDEPDRKTA